MDFQHPDAAYVGDVCYVRLDELIRMKVQFATCGVSGDYPALDVSIVNRREGEVDRVRLRFGEMLSTNTNAPFVRKCCGNIEWYGRKLTQEDYQKISGVLEQYMNVFQEQTQAAAQQWQPVMQ